MSALRRQALADSMPARSRGCDDGTVRPGGGENAGIASAGLPSWITRDPPRATDLATIRAELYDRGPRLTLSWLGRLSTQTPSGPRRGYTRPQRDRAALSSSTQSVMHALTEGMRAAEHSTSCSQVVPDRKEIGMSIVKAAVARMFLTAQGRGTAPVYFW